MMNSIRWRALGLAAAFAVTLGPRVASACGGCFAPPEVQQVVTDHRMVMAIHADESILWDQFRYTGRPQDFTWVLPVRGDVRIELGSEEFFDVLDQTTAPTLTPPVISCPRAGNGRLALFGASESAANTAPPGDVTVLNMQVVGPYQTVTLRATDSDALASWLRTNGYSIPTAIEPVIRYYNEMRTDFVALRLRPGEGINAMQPVRIRFATPSPVLPLRMVSAGVADKVGISLFIFGEGRQETVNFPNASIARDELVWDFARNRSNYPDVFAATIARSGGRAWVTEFANTSRIFEFRLSSMEARSDYAAATRGLSNPWVTRVRTDLLARFLDRDLQVGASASTASVANQIAVTRSVNAPRCATDDGLYSGTGTSSVRGLDCAVSRAGERRGTGAVGLSVGLALAALLARRRR